MRGERAGQLRGEARGEEERSDGFTASKDISIVII